MRPAVVVGLTLVVIVGHTVTHTHMLDLTQLILHPAVVLTHSRLPKKPLCCRTIAAAAHATHRCVHDQQARLPSPESGTPGAAGNCLQVWGTDHPDRLVGGWVCLCDIFVFVFCVVHMCECVRLCEIV